MTFPEIRASIDARIEAEPRLQGSHCELEGENSIWTLNRQVVTISPSGSTGILVEYISDERLVHSKIFAASPLSIERIVTTAAEHLTAYAFHRTQR
jgi:hypothetical protein